VEHRLILASSSPRRQELLVGLGLPFEVVVPAGIDESRVAGSAFAVCRELALRKAGWVLARRPPGGPTPIVIGCDTVVAVVRGGQERILGKPADADDARRMLRVLSGQTHRVLSAVAIRRPDAPPRVETEISHVTLRALRDEDIDAYVASGEPLDKAGAYGIQGCGGSLIASIRGCYLNIVGLPLLLLARLLDVALPPACSCLAHPLQTGSDGCRADPSPPPSPPELEIAVR